MLNPISRPENAVTSLLDIPIFPLDTVLFPGGRLSLRIFEARYVDMTKACIGDDAVFGVCQITEGREAGAPAVPAAIGCTARIKEWDVPSPGLFSLVTTGEQRFRILERRVMPDGLIRAQVQWLAPVLEQPMTDEHTALRDMLEAVIRRFGDDWLHPPARLDDAYWVACRLAEFLPMRPQERLRLLEQHDPRDARRGRGAGFGGRKKIRGSEARLSHASLPCLASGSRERASCRAGKTQSLPGRPGRPELAKDLAKTAPPLPSKTRAKLTIALENGLANGPLNDANFSAGPSSAS